MCVVESSYSGRLLFAGDAVGTLVIWDLLHDAAPVAAFQAHEEDVVGLCVSPHLNMLATCSYDGTVGLWKPLH